MNAFVGCRDVTADELGELVRNPAIALPSTYYFLRWFHNVSGIQRALPDDFPSPEGQLFNAKLELRWKQRGSNYDVLLLGETDPGMGFLPLAGEWECCDRNAYFYDNDETKFPKGFLYQDAKDVSVKQRYFWDSRTATIHFVALTVK